MDTPYAEHEEVCDIEKYLLDNVERVKFLHIELQKLTELEGSNSKIASTQQAAVDVTPLLNELDHLRSIEDGVNNLATTWKLVRDLERITRTAFSVQVRTEDPHPNSEESQILEQAVTKLDALHKTRAALSDNLPTLSAPVLEQIDTDVHTKTEASISAIRDRWLGSLDAALTACGWPPAKQQPSEPQPQWGGFQSAPEAALTQLHQSFVSLCRLQLAAGALEFSETDDTPDIGPWSHPELWAMRALARAPAHELRTTFCTGGILDRIDASAWLCQAAHKACEALLPHVDDLNAALAALGLGGRYIAHLEFVRAIHGEVTELLCGHRAPMFLETRGRGLLTDRSHRSGVDDEASGPADRDVWLQFADATVDWETKMLPLMGCDLPPERELIPTLLLRGSVLTNICMHHDQRLQQAWWNAEQSTACDAVETIVDASRSWAPAQALWLDASEAACPPWKTEYVYSIAAQEVEASIRLSFQRCLWLGSLTWRMVMVEVVIGSAFQVCVKALDGLSHQAQAYDDLLSPHWLSQVSCYACTARILTNIIHSLQKSTAFSASPTDLALALSEKEALLLGGSEMTMHTHPAAVLRIPGLSSQGPTANVAGAVVGVAGAIATRLQSQMNSSPLIMSRVKGAVSTVASAQGRVWQGLSQINAMGYSAVNKSVRQGFSGIAGVTGGIAGMARRSYLLTRKASTQPGNVGAAGSPTDDRQGTSSQGRANGAKESPAFPLQPELEALEDFWRTQVMELTRAAVSSISNALSPFHVHVRKAGDTAFSSGGAEELVSSFSRAVSLVESTMAALGGGLDRVLFRDIMRGIIVGIDSLLGQEIVLDVHCDEHSISAFQRHCQVLMAAFTPYTPRPVARFHYTRESLVLLTLLHDDITGMYETIQGRDQSALAAGFTAVGIKHLGTDTCKHIIERRVNI